MNISTMGITEEGAHGCTIQLPLSEGEYKIPILGLLNDKQHYVNNIK